MDSAAPVAAPERAAGTAKDAMLRLNPFIAAAAIALGGCHVNVAFHQPDAVVPPPAVVQAPRLPPPVLAPLARITAPSRRSSLPSHSPLSPNRPSYDPHNRQPLPRVCHNAALSARSGRVSASGG